MAANDPALEDVKPNFMAEAAPVLGVAEPEEVPVPVLEVEPEGFTVLPKAEVVGGGAVVVGTLLFDESTVSKRGKRGNVGKRNPPRRSAGARGSRGSGG